MELPARATSLEPPAASSGLNRPSPSKKVLWIGNRRFGRIVSDNIGRTGSFPIHFTTIPHRHRQRRHTITQHSCRPTEMRANFREVHPEGVRWGAPNPAAQSFQFRLFNHTSHATGQRVEESGQRTRPANFLWRTLYRVYPAGFGRPFPRPALS